MQLYIYFIIILTSALVFIFINRNLQHKREQRKERMKERRQELLNQLIDKN